MTSPDHGNPGHPGREGNHPTVDGAMCVHQLHPFLRQEAVHLPGQPGIDGPSKRKAPYLETVPLRPLRELAFGVAGQQHPMAPLTQTDQLQVHPDLLPAPARRRLCMEDSGHPFTALSSHTIEPAGTMKPTGASPLLAPSRPRPFPVEDRGHRPEPSTSSPASLGLAHLRPGPPARGFTRKQNHSLLPGTTIFLSAQSSHDFNQKKARMFSVSTTRPPCILLLIH